MIENINAPDNISINVGYYGHTFLTSHNKSCSGHTLMSMLDADAYSYLKLLYNIKQSQLQVWAEGKGCSRLVKPWGK